MKKKFIFLIIIIFLIIVAGGIFYFFYLNFERKIAFERKEKLKFENDFSKLKTQIEKLKNEDQYKKNKYLEETIKKIEQSYQETVAVYEKILDLRSNKKDVFKHERDFAEILNLLSKRNYISAEAKIKDLKNKINEETKKIISDFNIPQNVPQTNNLPSGGHQRQKVKIDENFFMVDIVAANLSDTRVIVDTASEDDCQNDCPVLSLADYVARNGAYAGINGSYFCPADYPSCADRKNSFDFLLMNKNKKYFNSDKNVYSTIPAVIFGGSYIRYVSQSLEWGRDTGIDSMIANYPLLVVNDNIVFSSSGENKLNIKSNRSFIGSSENNVYIGVVWNATVAESAKVIKVLGIKNALNLDSGGSTALWYQGYKAGPGRNLPNAILFVKK